MEEKLRDLYNEYFKLEGCIKRLKELKRQFCYGEPNKMTKKRQSLPVRTARDEEIKQGLCEALRNIRIFNIEDPFWDKIAQEHGRTRNECYNVWINEVMPFPREIGNEERSMIRKMVEDGREWLEISRRIERTPYEIFKAFIAGQRTARPKMWTREEDTLLCRGVADYGTSKWRFVSAVVGTKTGKECAMRYNFLNKNINKGKWSEEEEERLFKAVEDFGIESWKRISGSVMTRNEVQCRSKYYEKKGRNRGQK
jgi:hypothetical protein